MFPDQMFTVCRIHGSQHAKPVSLAVPFPLRQSNGALGFFFTFIGISTIISISVGALAALSWDHIKDALVRFLREGEGANLLELSRYVVISP